MRAGTRICEYIRVYARTYAYMRAYTVYASIYAYMRAYTRTCAHIRVYASIYAYMRAHTRICAHIRVYARIYAHMLVYTRICSHIRVYVCIYAYMHTYPFGQPSETAASLQRRSLGHRPARATPMIFDLGQLTAPSCSAPGPGARPSSSLGPPPSALLPRPCSLGHAPSATLFKHLLQGHSGATWMTTP